MANTVQGLLDKIVDKLGAEPCLLAILAIVLCCIWLIIYTYRHQERMEAMRLRQWSTMTGKRIKNNE